MRFRWWFNDDGYWRSSCVGRSATLWKRDERSLIVAVSCRGRRSSCSLRTNDVTADAWLVVGVAMLTRRWSERRRGCDEMQGGVGRLMVHEDDGGRTGLAGPVWVFARLRGVFRWRMMNERKEIAAWRRTKMGGSEVNIVESEVVSGFWPRCLLEEERVWRRWVSDCDGEDKKKERDYGFCLKNKMNGCERFCVWEEKG